ncbi:hypothetical protein [Klebsiella michiganensis]|uniref:hypothetical protein n=2 Tax=Klebsiella michiganensis TaxID=1134687 RepID=UPI003DA0AB5A
MTTDITELAQRVERIISDMKLKHGVKDTYAPVMKWDEFLELVEAVEKAQGMETYWKVQCRGITDHCEVLQARIAELESRTVKLPKRLSPEGYHIDEAYMVDDIEGEYLDRDEVIAALTTNGIKWEAE